MLFSLLSSMHEVLLLLLAAPLLQLLCYPCQQPPAAVPAAGYLLHLLGHSWTFLKYYS